MAPVLRLGERAPGLVALVLLAMLAGCGGSLEPGVAANGNGERIDPGVRGGQAVLVLDGVPLAFRATICSATPDDLVATGSGQAGDRPFVVTVRSPDIMVVKFGVHRELDTPPVGEAWLYGLHGTRLVGDGTAITGRASLSDVRAIEVEAVEARIDVVCD